jgi:hypothetical protein
MNDSEGNYMCSCDGPEHNPDCLYFASLEELELQRELAQQEEDQLADSFDDLERAYEKTKAEYEKAFSKRRELDERIKDRKQAERPIERRAA